MSSHGGSPGSGLVLPVGLERLKPDVPEGMVLVPQEVIDARKQAAERRARALQMARRSIAVDLMSGGAILDVTEALGLADQLIQQTGGEI